MLRSIQRELAPKVPTLGLQPIISNSGLPVYLSSGLLRMAVYTKGRGSFVAGLCPTASENRTNNHLMRVDRARALTVPGHASP